MKDIIFLGPPGCGKGTQAERFVDELNLYYIATGNMLRSHIEFESEIGRKASQYVFEGKLVPDSLIMDMLDNEIKTKNIQTGILFDGFPRTVGQAKELDKVFYSGNDRELTDVIYINISNEEIIKRIEGRAQKENREDDKNLDIIRTRIDNYNKQTVPLIEYYQDKKLLREVNGVGTVEDIYKRIKYFIK